MVSASTLLGSGKWALPTGDMNTTLAIGLAYIFLAYGVHPATKYAYLRVRAYRAWRRIEEGERVDVTNYPTWVELFGGCGRRDTARVVALLLLLFALASWILELSINLLPVPNPAYPQNLAPPVSKWPANGSTPTPWHVLNLTEIDPEYQRDWRNQPNVLETAAKSRYYVESYKTYVWSRPKDRYINDNIIVASWPPDNKPDNMVYGPNATVMVDGITCSFGGKAVTVTGEPTPVNRRNETGDIEEWGTVLECAQGPARMDVIGNSKPSVILTEHDTGDTHVIVEETSSEPSFLYSVWNATGDSVVAAGDSSVEIAYAFHIGSTVRLAEAVITGIVNGVAKDGGGGACFGLLRAYNDGNNSAGFSDSSVERALPFGEDPVPHRVPSLKDNEHIIVGVEMNTNAMVAFALVVGLSSIGFALTLFLCPKYEMDIYNRDELVRAITLQAKGLPHDPSRHSAMRIEVQREDRSRNLTVFISESDNERSGCKNFLLRRGPVTTDDPVQATDNAPHGLDGTPLPRGPVHMSLGGVVTWLSRPIPPPRNRAIHPEPVAPAMVLIASPVPSNAGSRVVSPTHPTAEGSSASAATPTFFSGASLLFCSSSSDVEGRIRCADDEEKKDADVEMGMSRGSRASGSGTF